jgi:hypothetical protein
MMGAARDPRIRAFPRGSGDIPALWRTAWCTFSESEIPLEEIQCSETLFGGQYVAKTFPIRFARGTVPQRRESHDCARLSPIMK